MVVLLWFSCMLLCSANGKLTSIATEDAWDLSMYGSTYFDFPCSSRLDWRVDSSISYEDFMLAQVIMEPYIAVETCIDPVYIRLGNMLNDHRFSMLSASALQLSLPSKTNRLPTGPPKVKSVHLAPREPASLGLSLPIVVAEDAEEIWVHIYGIHSQRSSYGHGVGLWTEVPTLSGVLRLGGLAIRGGRRSYLKSIHPYGARAIQRGVVSAISWSGKAIELVSSLYMSTQFLLRHAYDAALGTGLSVLAEIELIWNDLLLHYSRSLLPIWSGGVGTSAFSTRDAPLKREYLLASWRKADHLAEISCTDTWWRPTAFAGESQRRILRFRGRFEFEFSEVIAIGLRATLERRWNRTGSQGETVTAAIPVSLSVQSVDLSVRPEVRWTNDPIWSVHLQMHLPETHGGSRSEVAVSLGIGDRSLSVSLKFTVPVDTGNLVCELTPEGEVRVTYSIDL